MKAVAYYRVSTDRQGGSGLGLEAQRETVRTFLEGQGWPPLSEYTEVESGRLRERPELKKALAACRVHKATLVIAKLDRLARNQTFLMELIDSGTHVAFCDLPQVPPGPTGRFILQQMAAVAELEAGLISERTKAALKAAKERGATLGGYRGYTPSQKDRQKGLRTRQERSNAFAQDIHPVIEKIKQEGVSTLNGIAKALNGLGITTARGGLWSATQVSRMKARL